MRIAYVCADPGVPVFGKKGNSVHVQEVVRALLARGEQVELFAARTGGEAPPGLQAVRVHELAPLPKGDMEWRERAALRANGDLLASLEREGPFDLVYERYSLWSFAGMQYACSQEIPGLLEVNAPLIEEQALHRGLANRTRAQRIAHCAFGAASGLLAVSEEVAAYLNGYPEARGRVHVVPNGVDPDRFPSSLAPTLPAPAGTFTIGFVGTLKPWHGLDTLVEAVAALRISGDNARLLIVGDGPERASVERMLAERGLTSIAKLVGAVDPAEVPGLLASMDVAVAPYPKIADFYFSPLKVYEYMAARLPVVASRIGQLDGLIEHGRNGILCSPGDRAALARSLDMLRRDPSLRARLGRAGRETVMRDHTWRAVAERILHIANRERYMASAWEAGEAVVPS